MNLLRVIASMNPQHGGPCQGIRNSIPELEKLGVHNEVVTLDDPNSSFLTIDSFTIHALGPCKRPWLYSSKVIPWLLLNLKRFDAVILHGLWLYPGYATSKAIQILKTQLLTQSCEHVNIPKLFIMPHGMLDPYFQQALTRKLKALRNWIYWKLIEGKVVNNADGLLFTCEDELLLARETFKPYKPKREINVGYGIQAPPIFNIDMHNAFRNICPMTGSQSYLLFLGRIHEKKGVDLLIKAYASLLKMEKVMPKLVIAGPGLETLYGKKLHQSVLNNPKLKQMVFFPGMLSGKAKWGAFYGCESFILPSHQENFGISIVEAMACGKPVLISKRINISKEIKAQGGGLIEDDTLEGVKKLLSNWKKMPDCERKTMEYNAQRSFMNNFSIAQTAKRFLEAVII